MISAERIFCGLGIPFIYKFMSGKYTPDAEVKENIRGEDIYKLALAGDEVSKKTVFLFFELLAATLQHLTAALCPENGIILAGSNLIRMKDMFLEEVAKEDSIFFKTFYNNSSLRSFLEKIPIYLCVKDELGLFGCMVSIINKV